MKILMVNRSLAARSAGESMMFILAQELAKQGNTISWFAREGGKAPDIGEAYVVPYARKGSRRQFRRRRFFDDTVYQAMRARLADDRPDLVLVWQLGDLTWAPVKALFDSYIPTYVMMTDYAPLCCRHDFNCDGEDCLRCAGKRRWYAVRYRCVNDSYGETLLAVRQENWRRRKGVYDLPWGYITGSAWQSGLLRKSGFTTRPLIELDLPVELPPENEVTCTRGEYFLYAGAVDSRHGVHTLLTAMKHAVTDMPLVIAGDGSELNEMRRLAEELGIEKRVRFLGRLRSGSLKQVMHDCHCMIAPSECEEIAPWLLLQGLAMGKPAIVSNCSVLPERVTDGENGWVFQHGKVLDLAQIMDDMADLPDSEYKAMAEKARKEAVERYDIAAYAKRILALDRYGGGENEYMDEEAE